MKLFMHPIIKRVTDMHKKQANKKSSTHSTIPNKMNIVFFISTQKTI